jgi:hypothetical protein
VRQKRRDEERRGAGGGEGGRSEASVATGTEEREADERE